MKNLAQIITELRDQRGITQEQLSVLSGINQAHISRIESGKNKPTMPTVFRLCKALEIDPIVLADILAEEFRTYIKHNFHSKISVNG
ncbi:MAG: XRE family transcriptional regulator [Cytophagia bacterium]|jgi:transcriptional regulator with XRE-family HTH domain|nr:MAG: XRE family transcriptional regulator [Cytophagales bacterium]TAG37860.1 MAG: XRE family transcriptional regulator [Cytophagia bacterium]TAG79122.1 MAG: XRE family transcriptional regulator [Cytophagales bacterium]